MNEHSRYIQWYGRDEAPVEAVTLRAGPLTALLDGIDLRYVRLAGVEVVRRIYVAVRDHNWDTIPGEVHNLRREVGADRFSVSFDVSHRRGAVDFTWRGRIEGSPEGTIRYAMDGVAESAFRYNRIGFCVLHPPAESAGQPYRGRTPEGEIAGLLPEYIGPQRIEQGTILPLFPSVEWLEIDQASGVRARFVFEGDLFEMEDQRNWTDASFKTYCTPLALPWPKDAAAGQAIAQAVTFTAESGRPIAQPAEEPAVLVQIGGRLGRAVPPIGLGMASHGGALTAREITILRELRPAHLRVDVPLEEAAYPALLARAVETARALGCALEPAITLGADPEAELTALATRLDGGVSVARILVFRRGEAGTAGNWVRLARERLGAAAGDAIFAGGTNMYFTELNRNRPEVAAMDAVAYSINPQVHAFDDRSLMETVTAQADTVRSTRAFSGNLPIVVSPITLKPRFNPNATGPEPEPGPGELPAPVDARQMSLFGAAWTVGSAKYLAESGVAALTYYETTGWRGVMETESGAPRGAPFPSHPRMVFPLYHVLADLCAWRGAALLECRSGDPLRVEALALQAMDGTHLLLANMTAGEQQVLIGPLPAGAVAARVLDEQSAARAADEPQRFRAETTRMEVQEGGLSLTLAPYAMVRLDLG